MSNKRRKPHVPRPQIPGQYNFTFIEEETFVCSSCLEKFTNQRQLYRHIGRVHSSNVAPMDEQAVKSLIESLNVYDTNCQDKKHVPYCPKLKVHLLIHLTEDIKKFGTVLNFETERGEQFNKHVREHLIFSNRLNTSRDISLKFGKQAMLRHIMDGGSWVSKEGKREKIGQEAALFTEENKERFFFYLAGESREFQDNNNVIRPQAVQEGSFAVFDRGNNQCFLGIVCGSFVKQFSVCEGEYLEKGCLCLTEVNPFTSLELNNLHVKQVLDSFEYKRSRY